MLTHVPTKPIKAEKEVIENWINTQGAWVAKPFLSERDGLGTPVVISSLQRAWWVQTAALWTPQFPNPQYCLEVLTKNHPLLGHKLPA